MAAMLLLTLRGTPTLYYGDEIGMDDVEIPPDRVRDPAELRRPGLGHGRDPARTPMQWDASQNAGFSTAEPWLPLGDYRTVNVEAQERTRSSLLSWLRRLVRVRQRYPVFGGGKLRFQNPANRKVLCFLRYDASGSVLVACNLSRHAQPAELDLADWKGFTPVELIGETPFPRVTERPYQLTLAPYGFLWFRLERPVHSLGGLH